MQPEAKRSRSRLPASTARPYQDFPKWVLLLEAMRGQSKEWAQARSPLLESESQIFSREVDYPFAKPKPEPGS